MKGTFECAKVHCQSAVGALQGNAPNSWGRGGGGWSGGFGLPRSQVNAFPMSKSVMIGFGIVLYIFILL